MTWYSALEWLDAVGFCALFWLTTWALRHRR